jgi:hypothetical protein
MTFEEFQQESSARNIVCPKCKTSNTEPNPGCPCRSEGNLGHIMKYHHVCPKPIRFYDSSNDVDVIETLKEREIL